MAARNGTLWHHFDDLEHQGGSNLLGMWLFLASEVLVFGALFTGYSAYRWRYSAAFLAASEHLNLWIGGVNTVVLLTSSLTMALAVQAARLGRQRTLVCLLAGTAALGVGFLALKAVEYHGDFVDRLVPGLAFDVDTWRRMGLRAEQVQLFYLFYYVMTGLHAVHLSIGIGVMVILTVMAWQSRYSSDYHAPVEMWGLYWHFVDIVWIFLLPLLYLVGTRIRP